MNDKSVRQNVIDALDWEPSIDSAHIGVAVDRGVAVLSGHVPNYAQKAAAERIAKRVKGVAAIVDEITVRYPGSSTHRDEDIAARAVQALNWDVFLPDNVVQVKVSKGWITLSGELDWDYQRHAAEAAVRNLRGVIGVSNQISLKRHVSPADVSHRIEDALKRDASVEAARIRVSASDGKVTLEGKVHSLHEREAVERAVWAAPGVHSVVDHLAIG
ncbi:BON domain-containing protein [Caulobacter sp. 602-1]|uniref:BON domain-containing protein n=1 Tax=Caulobacter sp. 602-1 TaxID=2492472 RepID=UPI000F64499D|nr:BON domain-containing protein [Caulobacter sp. 602-1]RRN64274.1 BON domain-containing protein [Caulobacter sp. 602-1]